MFEQENEVGQSNLVFFPGNGKGFIDDPLDDLVNEFSEVAGIQDGDHEELINLVGRVSLLESNIGKAKNVSELLALVDNQLSLLKDVRTRIDYLEREMESYIVPRT